MKNTGGIAQEGRAALESAVPGRLPVPPTIWCARCRVGGVLTPLSGTNRAFCKECADVVRAQAAYMASKGVEIEDILEHFRKRYEDKETKDIEDNAHAGA